MGQGGRSPKSILIVEDNIDLLDCYREMLVPILDKVYTAANYEQCLKLLELDVRPNFFLIDILMPGKNGSDLISELRPKYPHAVIVATSGDISDATINKSISLGANHFLEKPFHLDKLKKILSVN